MIRLLGNIPKEDFYVGCSGGVDSMAVLDFLLNGGYTPKVAYFDHFTDHSKEASEFVREICRDRRIEFVPECVARKRDAFESPEEYWRNERYRFFFSLGKPVITAHQLDDVVEWWIFTSLNGWPEVIPYQRNNVIRPFLATPRSELKSWCERHAVPWIEDPSNKETRFARNRIRHNIVPQALEVNPGLRKVVKKRVEGSYVQSGIAPYGKEK